MPTAVQLTLDLAAYVNLFIMVDPNKLICCCCSETLGSCIHICSRHWMTTDYKIYPIIEAILFIIHLTNIIYFISDKTSLLLLGFWDTCLVICVGLVILFCYVRRKFYHLLIEGRMSAVIEEFSIRKLKVVGRSLQNHV